MREHENEPLPGLPEPLPEDERILWQGAPRRTSLASRVFHIRGVGVYLALLVGWGTSSTIASGPTAAAATLVGVKLAAMAFAALAGLLLFAHLIACTTLYTVTNRRIVMRFGVALPITMNIPMSAVASADLKTYGDGTGDIPIALSGKDRQSLVVLWPHVRPWHATRPQPMLRCVPAAREVAEILSAALNANAGQRPTARTATSRPTPIDQDVVRMPARETVAA